MMKPSSLGVVLLFLLSVRLGASSRAQCGREADGALCEDGLCCSEFGFCSSTTLYCGERCQSQCRPGGTGPPSAPTPTPSGDLGSIIPESLYNEMLKHRLDGSCDGGFYSYNAFINAARSFPGFGTTGDAKTRKREIAAFFAQTSHETTGGWASAPDGPYAWGYCYIQENGENRADYCRADAQWPCAPNREYFGRGPMQIKWNYNYGPAGRAIGVDLLNNPDLVVGDPVVSFKTAFWLWMTPQSPKPSPHDVVTGFWTPSAADAGTGRVPGFGFITNIINGGVECGKGENEKGASRIGFYRRYCSLLGISPGDNLDCYNQTPYPS